MESNKVREKKGVHHSDKILKPGNQVSGAKKAKELKTKVNAKNHRINPINTREFSKGSAMGSTGFFWKWECRQ